MHNFMQIVKDELDGLYGESVLSDLAEILYLYDVYEGYHFTGKDFNFDNCKKNTNFIKKLIKEQARFLFGKTPEISAISRDTKAAQDSLAFLNKTLSNNLSPICFWTL